MGSMGGACGQHLGRLGWGRGAVQRAGGGVTEVRKGRVSGQRHGVCGRVSGTWTQGSGEVAEGRGRTWAS